MCHCAEGLTFSQTCIYEILSNRCKCRVLVLPSVSAPGQTPLAQSTEGFPLSLQWRITLTPSICTYRALRVKSMKLPARLLLKFCLFVPYIPLRLRSLSNMFAYKQDWGSVFRIKLIEIKSHTSRFCFSFFGKSGRSGNRTLSFFCTREHGCLPSKRISSDINCEQWEKSAHFIKTWV